MSAAEDARYDRDHGGIMSAAEAPAMARLRRAEGRRDMGGYYDDAYAAEIESWTHDRSGA